VARDEEFRKVAEDIGALARSLGRDFREAVDQARRGGYPPGRAVRHGLRGMSDEARRGLRTGWSPPRARHHGRPWNPWEHGSGYFGSRTPWGPPPAPDPPGDGTGPAASQFVGPPGPTIPGGAAGPPWTGPGGPGGVGRHGAPGAAVAWPGPATDRPRSPRNRLPPVRHRWDATTVAGMLAVLFGVAWLIGATGLFHFSIEGVVAVGLMLLGASLIVTGRTDWSLSRRSWPVWLGLGLIAILVATSSTFGLGGTLNSVSFGSMSRTAALDAGVPPVVHGGFGSLNVALRGTPTADETLKVVSVAGQTTVQVPPMHAYDINVDARVFAGRICIAGQKPSGGMSQEASASIPANTAVQGAPALTLNVRQMFGEIVIGGGSC
jgi:hypothetical protein